MMTLPRKCWPLALCLALLLLTTAQTPLEQTLPTILRFETDTPALSLAQVEAGTEVAILSWQIAALTEDYQVQVYAYEIATWVLISDPEADYAAEDRLEILVRHPLNFNPPSYRLIVTDEGQQVYSEALLTLPYTTDPAAPAPRIASFTVEPLSLTADQAAYGGVDVIATWAVENRRPGTNLRFQQILNTDGEAVSAEFSRRNLWVSSAGSGALRVQAPESGGLILLSLQVVDLLTGEVLDESGQQITVTGTLSTPTPAPRNTAAADNNAPPAALPPPVVNAGAGTNFELGGHVASFARLDVAQSAGMTWVKKQIRWRRGEGVGTAADIINSGQASGFKVLLGIVGDKGELAAGGEAYTAEFTAYLAEVARLNPNAIEVWNEPNIDREWPAGQISGEAYTAMLAAAFNAIKAANPNVMVISGAPAPTGFFGGTCRAEGCDDNVFLRQMARAGAADYMDCIGAHYNEGILSPDQTSGDPRSNHYSRYFVGMLNLYYNTFNGARPVCWTELGFLSPEGYPPLPAGFTWAGETTVAEQADWLRLAAQRSQESGRVRLLIVWNVDFSRYDSDPQGGYAILRPDGVCPACAGLAELMR